MTYVPKDWVTGEVITEQALDHIEQGIAAIGGGVAMINVTTDGVLKRLGKSYNEIVALIENGTLPVAVETVGEGGKDMMVCAGFGEGGEPITYGVVFAKPTDPIANKVIFSAETATAELTYNTAQ